MGTGLFERDGELAAIDGALAHALIGEGVLVLIEGPAGIGKTALLEEASQRAAAAGACVLSARGGELERGFPFGIVRQLFEPVVRALPAAERGEILAGAAALTEPLVTGAEAVTSGHAGDDRSFAMLHGLYWLTANLAERASLMIAVDDLHWVDAPSLRFLSFLARRRDGLALVVIGCARPGEDAHEPSLIDELLAEPGTSTLRPTALSSTAVAELIRLGLGAVPAPEFVAACWAATRGTPFLVHELIGALAADGVAPSASEAGGVDRLGPATVARATLLRIARLAPAAASVARAIAVCGPNAESNRVAELAGLDGATVRTVVDRLARIHVLAPDRPLRFVHPIVRAAVYDDLASGERSAGHARVAALLSEEGADADSVAGHLLNAAPSRQRLVVEQLRSAAARALSRGAAESAVSYLARALEEGGERNQRGELLYELADAERLISPVNAIEHLRQARGMLADPRQRARAGADLAAILVFSGQWELALETTDVARGELGDRDRELAVELEGFGAVLGAYDPQLVDRFDGARGALRAAFEEGVVSARRSALLLAAIASFRGEGLSDVASLVGRALDDGTLLADEAALWSLSQATAALVITEQLGGAERLTEEILSHARNRGSVYGYLIATLNGAWIDVRRGDLVRAEAEIRATIELAQEHGLVFVLPSVLWMAADALVERPELADIAELVMGMELPPGLAATYSGAMVLHVRGRLRHLNGDIDGAITDLRAVWETAAALRFRNPNSDVSRSLLALLLIGVDRGEASTVAQAELEDARRVGFPRCVGRALMVNGVVEGGEPGLDYLRQAVTVLRDSPARLELARALVELGAALRRANRRSEARQPLAEGLELARRCGATRLAGRARSELMASGARPRRELRTGVDALTPSELRVARMAADGMTNPQIGQALFVTRNTVETHLRHVYSKLDIRSREELPSQLRTPMS